MQEEKVKLEQENKALLEKVEMLEYIVKLYENREAYRRELNSELEVRISYLEATKEHSQRKGAKVVPIGGNIRKLSPDL